MQINGDRSAEGKTDTESGDGGGEKSDALLCRLTAVASCAMPKASVAKSVDATGLAGALAVRAVSSMSAETRKVVQAS